jgi:hypothetical protein
MFKSHKKPILRHLKRRFWVLTPWISRFTNRIAVQTIRLSINMRYKFRKFLKSHMKYKLCILFYQFLLLIWTFFQQIRARKTWIKKLNLCLKIAFYFYLMYKFDKMVNYLIINWLHHFDNNELESFLELINKSLKFNSELLEKLS